MNALNEVNKVITSVSYYAHRHSSQLDEDEWLNAEKMAVSLRYPNHISSHVTDCDVFIHCCQVLLTRWVLWLP